MKTRYATVYDCTLYSFDVLRIAKLIDMKYSSMSDRTAYKGYTHDVQSALFRCTSFQVFDQTRVLEACNHNGLRDRKSQ